MRSVVNQKLSDRNAKIGQYTNLAAFAIMVGGVFIYLKSQAYLGYWFVAILGGFVLFQISSYFTNRWGRNPRPHVILDRYLKGLGREFIIYHYITPVSHLLVSPAGIWALLPYYQNATVVYEKKRWRVHGGGFLQAYLRFFGQDSIGRPDLDANAEIEAAKRYFERVLPDGTPIPDVQAAMIFVDPRVELHADEAPMVYMQAKELKEFLRQKAKERPIGMSMVDTIQNALPQPENE